MQRFVLSSLLILLLGSLAFPAQAQSDHVVTTNYPNVGDMEAAPVRTTPARYNDYSNMETDPVSITQAERDAIIAKLHKELAPGTNVETLNRWSDVKEGLNAIQIVNNVPVQGVLFTIFLPTNWKRSARVPVVLSGDGLGDSNNNRLWKSGDTGIVGLVGLSAIPGFKPIIGVYCNSGGSESMGIDEHTYRAIGAFFDFIGKNGGDPQRVVTEGGSRGGLNALMWSINPLKLNYNVIATFADIMPTAMGTLSQRSVQTYPNMSYLFSTAAHNPDLYRYDVASGAGHYDLKALIGTDDPAEADARSPVGMADRLKGKVLVIGRGTHDPFIPLRDFIAFDHRLTELGITHTTLITLGQGHNGSPYLLNDFAYYVRGLMGGPPAPHPSGRYFYINLNPPYGTHVPLSAFIKSGLNADPKAAPEKALALPFTAEIPAGAGVGLPVDVSICGAPGTSFSYVSQDANGNVWTKGAGKIGSDECVHTEIKAPNVTGGYAWTFTYDNKPIPLNYTPRRDQNGCGSPAVTVVTEKQPSPAILDAGVFALGYGLDQYIAQKSGC